MSHDLLVGCRHETQATVKLNWFTTSLLLLFAFPPPGAFRLLLQEIRRGMRVTNMGLERLLKDKDCFSVILWCGTRGDHLHHVYSRDYLAQSLPGRWLQPLHGDAR